MKYLYIILLISFSFQIQAQNIGINDDGSTPHPGAILDIKSSDKGILIPRISDTSDIVSPVLGLMTFSNSDSIFWYYNGLKWINLLSQRNNSTNQQLPNTAEEKKFTMGTFQFVDDNEDPLEMDNVSKIQVFKVEGISLPDSITIYEYNGPFNGSDFGDFEQIGLDSLNIMVDTIMNYALQFNHSQFFNVGIVDQDGDCFGSGNVKVLKMSFLSNYEKIQLNTGSFGTVTSVLDFNLKVTYDNGTSKIFTSNKEVQSADCIDGFHFHTRSLMSLPFSYLKGIAIKELSPSKNTGEVLSGFYPVEIVYMDTTFSNLSIKDVNLDYVKRISILVENDTEANACLDDLIDNNISGSERTIFVPSESYTTGLPFNLDAAKRSTLISRGFTFIDGASHFSGYSEPFFLFFYD